MSLRCGRVVVSDRELAGSTTRCLRIDVERSVRQKVRNSEGEEAILADVELKCSL